MSRDRKRERAVHGVSVVGRGPPTNGVPARRQRVYEPDRQSVFRNLHEARRTGVDARAGSIQHFDVRWRELRIFAEGQADRGGRCVERRAGGRRARHEDEMRKRRARNREAGQKHGDKRRNARATQAPGGQ